MAQPARCRLRSPAHRPLLRANSGSAPARTLHHRGAPTDETRDALIDHVHGSISRTVITALSLRSSVNAPPGAGRTIEARAAPGHTRQRAPGVYAPADGGHLPRRRHVSTQINLNNNARFVFSSDGVGRYHRRLGYTGAELLRLCHGHPDLTWPGPLPTPRPAPRSPTSTRAWPPPTRALVFVRFDPRWPPRRPRLPALPHGASQELVPACSARGSPRRPGRRLPPPGPAAYPQWYGEEHTRPDLLGRFAYGLPELHREDIAAASRRRARLLPDGRGPGLRAARRAGPSRRGRDRRRRQRRVGCGTGPKHTTHFGTVNEDFVAYGLLDHRHTPEMEQATGAQLLFTPHLAPMTRGILATCYARPPADSTEELLALLDRPMRASRSWSSTTAAFDQGHVGLEHGPPHRPLRPPHRLGRRARRPRQPGQGGVGPGGPVRQPDARPDETAGLTSTGCTRDRVTSEPNTGVTAPEGFVAAGVACGIKPSGALDLALIATDDGRPVPRPPSSRPTRPWPRRAGQPGPPRRHQGPSCGRRLNSGNANAATGAPGAATPSGCAPWWPTGWAARTTSWCAPPGSSASPCRWRRWRPASPAGRGRQARRRRRRRREAIMTTDTVPRRSSSTAPASRSAAWPRGRPCSPPTWPPCWPCSPPTPRSTPATCRPPAGRRWPTRSTPCRRRVHVHQRHGHPAGQRQGRPADLGAVAPPSPRRAPTWPTDGGDAEGATRSPPSWSRARPAAATPAGRPARWPTASWCSARSYGADPYWGRIVSELGSAGVELRPRPGAVAYGGIACAPAGWPPTTTPPPSRPTWPVVTCPCRRPRPGRRPRRPPHHRPRPGYIDENMGTS